MPKPDTWTARDSRADSDGGGASSAYLFVAFACDTPLVPPTRHSLADVDMVQIGRGERRVVDRRVRDGARWLEVSAPDRWMSGKHARIVRVRDKWILEDHGSRNGTMLNGERLGRETLASGDLFECGQTFFVFRDDLPRTSGPPDFDAAQSALPVPALATILPTLQRELSVVPQLAASPVSLVLAGETGTGKEVVAQAVHTLSRRPGPFVPVNCGAIPETLVPTELFGYKKGAFSGASSDRLGLVRSADRGTLFLDEVGDLPEASQAAFLRVLQEREVMPVGASRATPVDIRLVAATHRDLESLVAKGRFRADLFARISGYTVTLPPLRARREDLGLLVAAVLPRVAHDVAARVAFSPSAVRAIFGYPWPLNIRELATSLQTAAVLATDGVIEPSHLPDAVRTARSSFAASASPDVAVRPLSDDDETRRRELGALLREHDGNISAVARASGKARSQIQRWVKRYGLSSGNR